MNHKINKPGTNKDADRLFIPIRNKTLKNAISDYKERTGKSYEQIMAECLNIPMDDDDILKDILKGLEEQLIRMSNPYEAKDIPFMLSNLSTVFGLLRNGKLQASTCSNYILKLINEGIR